MVGEFILEYNRRVLNNFSVYSEFFGTWDDVAGQDGMFFSPDIFKKYFFPFYKKLIELIKEKDLVFSWHCCGSIHEVLPMMIKAGIDIFNVVQTSAKNMEIEKIYNLYSRDVCLCGAIDSQKLLVFGSKKDIMEEIKKIKSLWNKKGGLILGPSHEIAPDTPIENILTIYNLLGE